VVKGMKKEVFICQPRPGRDVVEKKTMAFVKISVGRKASLH
jgi:hypothetical protein